jgi:phasin
MRKTSTTASETMSAGAPKMEAPKVVREMADKGIAQAKQSYEKMSAATAEVSNVIQNAYSTAAQGAMNCSVKVIEHARTNSNAAFDYVSKLVGVKSPSEVLEVSTEHARKQFEALSEQTKELTALNQKAMLEATEPLKASVEKAFRSPLA